MGTQKNMLQSVRLSQAPSNMILITASRNRFASSSPLILLCYRMSAMTGQVIISDSKFWTNQSKHCNCTHSVTTVG